MKYPKMIISAWQRTTLLVMAVAALAACNDLIPKEDYVSIGNVTMEEFVVASRTKAAPATALPSTFFCWAQAYSSSSGNQLWMSNETFNKQGSTSTYKSSNKYGTIPSGYSIKYWAIAISNTAYIYPTYSSTDGFVMNAQTDNNANNQEDILVASSATVSGSSASASLSFEHVLCQVKINTAFDNVLAGTVTEVTLTNVKKVGAYFFNSGTWTTSGTAGSVTFGTSQVISTTSENVQLGTDAKAFMLIPQTLPSTSKLRVAINGMTVETSMSGVVLTKGRCVTLRIKFSSDSVSTGNDTDAAVVSPMSAPYKMFVEIEEDDIEDKTFVPNKNF